MELHHFSHEHKLKLCRAKKNDDMKISCYGCLKPILGLLYGCIECNCFLHKACAQLPTEMTHPSHAKHGVITLQYSSTNCDVCGDEFYGFFYRCSSCLFAVDLKCASIVNSIKQGISISDHKYHPKHRLIPLQKPTLFECDACGRKHEDSSYVCTTCGIWVSQTCANSLPKTIQLDQHSHPLTLIDVIQDNYLLYKSIGSCNICNNDVCRKNWHYYCSECGIFLVHLSCVPAEATVKSKDDDKIENEDPHDDLDFNLIEINSSFLRDLYRDLINLPNKTNESPDDVITQFIKDMGLKGEHKEVAEYRHVNHDHLPLIFCHEQIDSKDETCNGCAQSISAGSFYRCGQCNFVLHEWCAVLPTELRHPFHPEHRLFLTTNLHIYQCDCCILYNNMFRFECSDCKFFLDLKCASLPHFVRHEAHDHILALRKMWSQYCSTCHSYCGFGYTCNSCNHNLCVRCALLPYKVTHRYDEHPFVITYSFIKDEEVDEDYCVICEEEINPKLWYYHCHSCVQSLHSNCLLPVDKNSNIKYGATLEIKGHPHPLAVVQSPKENSPCNCCDEPFDSYYNMAYECVTCKFWIHRDCIRKLAYKKNLPLGESSRAAQDASEGRSQSES